MGGRISRGWRLAKDSLAVVREDSALVALSVLGLVFAVLLAAVPTVGAAWGLGGDQQLLGWVLLALALFLAYFAITFFGVAIALAAADVLDGKDATVGAALAGATRRLGPIAGWAVVGAAVNVLFAVLREKGGIAGNVLAGVGGAAWSLVTFLAVPVIAFEGLGPIATLKRSAGLFRERWGEQLTGNVSISFVFFLVSLPAIALAVLGFVLGGAFGVTIGVLGVVAALVIWIVGRAASATFGAVLYRYAALGDVAGSFSQAELAGVAHAA
jgi:hypothetical protein